MAADKKCYRAMIVSRFAVQWNRSDLQRNVGSRQPNHPRHQPGLIVNVSWKKEVGAAIHLGLRLTANNARSCAAAARVGVTALQVLLTVKPNPLVPARESAVLLRVAFPKFRKPAAPPRCRFVGPESNVLKMSVVASINSQVKVGVLKQVMIACARAFLAGVTRQTNHTTSKLKSATRFRCRI